MKEQYDVIIIGAGAAGLMCAMTAGGRGRSVLLIDHAKKIGEKIRISGGGRCNFTNLHASPAHYLSHNPHFCKSALKQYTQHDFIALVEKHGIAYHEKTLGQLFCDESAQQIIDMLLDECDAAGVDVRKESSVESIMEHKGGGYAIKTPYGSPRCGSLVIATGGLSIPKIGATKFGYEVARQFGLNVLETRAGLVPLTFQAQMLEFCKGLTGVSVDANVRAGEAVFREGLLFTHRGLSGPSILQISSYWQETQDIAVDLHPGEDVFAYLKTQKEAHPKRDLKTVLSGILPDRLVEQMMEDIQVTGRMADLSHKSLQAVSDRINDWRIRPAGTEGYRTAEVTLGGVDTDELSSKTMETKKHPGLYFIGEVVDVTGWLGGYNFQWAWSSGYVAGLHA